MDSLTTEYIHTWYLKKAGEAFNQEEVTHPFGNFCLAKCLGCWTCRTIPYFSILFQITKHDDHSCFQLIHHSPEVIKRILFRPCEITKSLYLKITMARIRISSVHKQECVHWSVNTTNYLIRNMRITKTVHRTLHSCSGQSKDAFHR